MSSSHYVEYRKIPEARGYCESFLSHEATLQLIEEVRQHEHLWNKYDEFYESHGHNLVSWNTIITGLFVNGCADADCAVDTWDNLYDAFFERFGYFDKLTMNDEEYFNQMDKFINAGGEPEESYLGISNEDFLKLPIIKKHFFKHSLSNYKQQQFLSGVNQRSCPVPIPNNQFFYPYHHHSYAPAASHFPQYSIPPGFGAQHPSHYQTAPSHGLLAPINASLASSTYSYSPSSSSYSPKMTTYTSRMAPVDARKRSEPAPKSSESVLHVSNPTPKSPLLTPEASELVSQSPEPYSLDPPVNHWQESAENQQAKANLLRQKQDLCFQNRHIKHYVVEAEEKVLLNLEEDVAEVEKGVARLKTMSKQDSLTEEPNDILDIVMEKPQKCPSEAKLDTNAPLVVVENCAIEAVHGKEVEEDDKKARELLSKQNKALSLRVYNLMYQRKKCMNGSTITDKIEKVKLTEKNQLVRMRLKQLKTNLLMYFVYINSKANLLKNLQDELSEFEIEAANIEGLLESMMYMSKEALKNTNSVKAEVEDKIAGFESSNEVGQIELTTPSPVVETTVTATPTLAAGETTAMEGSVVQMEHTQEAVQTESIIQEAEMSTPEQPTRVPEDGVTIQETSAPRSELSTFDHIFIHIIAMLIVMFFYQYFTN